MVWGAGRNLQGRQGAFPHPSRKSADGFHNSQLRGADNQIVGGRQKRFTNALVSKYAVSIIGHVPT